MEKQLVPVAQGMDAQALIAAAIDKGASIETLERLVALAKDVRSEEAKRAWYEAMAQFQRTCPPIKRSESAKIQTRSGGSYSYTYAPLGEIMATITPIMGPLGLSVSYRVHHEPDRVIAACRVSHEAGHYEESGEVSMPIVADAENRGANPAQRVGIASTYAKRYALLAIIGLAPEDDPDAEPQPKRETTVQEPRRKSEQAAQPVADDIWRGRIVGTDTKTGTTGNKPWTLHLVKGDGGVTFGTFDAKTADELSKVGDNDVEIIFTTTPKGGRNIESWAVIGHAE